jgi:CubicO group peptidase (beta-lactamase class C family)
MKLRRGDPEEAGMSAERIRRAVLVAERSVAAGGALQVAERSVAAGETQALVVLAARRGVIVLHEAFGRLTPDDDAPPLPLDAIYPIASLTKPITATAVLILVEDGLIGLNRPVAEYVPEFVGDGKDRVMVHHLLTHTSGLLEEDVDRHVVEKRWSVAVPPAEATQHPRVHEYLSLGYDAPLWKPPGEEMSYNNYGWELLGEIVRRVSGRSLADFARERILDPLGMKDTYYIVPESRWPRIVRRPLDAPDAIGVKGLAGFFVGLEDPELRELPWACGGAYTTVPDLAAFGQTFLNRGRYGDARILSPASVAEMTRNQIPGISARLDDEYFPEAYWGLGWHVHGNKRELADASLLSPRAFGHGGHMGTQLWVDPDRDVVAVYFSAAARLRTPGIGISSKDLFVNAVLAAVEE